MIPRSHRILTATLLIFAMFGANALYADDDAPPEGLKPDIVKLIELTEIYENSLSDLKGVGFDPNYAAEYFDVNIRVLMEIQELLSQDSHILNSIEDQRRILQELGDRVSNDRNVLADSQFNILAEQISEQEARLDELRLEVEEASLRIRNNVTELESLRLFTQYQLQLSSFSSVAGYQDSVLQIMKSSADSLSGLSTSIVPLTETLLSQ